jgi:hypothetical protein
VGESKVWSVHPQTENPCDHRCNASSFSTFVLHTVRVTRDRTTIWHIIMSSMTACVTRSHLPEFSPQQSSISRSVPCNRRAFSTKVRVHVILSGHPLNTQWISLSASAAYIRQTIKGVSYLWPMDRSDYVSVGASDRQDRHKIIDLY